MGNNLVDFLDDCFLWVEHFRVMLSKITYANPVSQPDCAHIGFNFSGHHSEQGGFAASIRPNNRYSFAFQYSPGESLI